MTSYKLINQSGLESLKKAESKAISETEVQINFIDGCISDYEAVIERLGNLSKTSCHEIKVPLGKFAFMPGQLVETDRITVNLGGKWFVETTAKHASEIIERRVKALRERKEKFEKQKDLMTTRLEFTDQFGQEGEQCVEIVEELDEEAEKTWRVKHRENVLRDRRKELEGREKSDHISVEELFKRFNYDSDCDNDKGTTETAKRIERPRMPVRNEVEVAAAARAVAAAESISSEITVEENEDEESDDDEEIKADFREYLKSIGITVGDAVCRDDPSRPVTGTGEESGDGEGYETKAEQLLEPESFHPSSTEKMVEKNICNDRSSDIGDGVEMNCEIIVKEQSQDHQDLALHPESVHLHRNLDSTEHRANSCIKDCSRNDEVSDVRESDFGRKACDDNSGNSGACKGRDPENNHQLGDEKNELVKISVVMPKSSDAQVEGRDVDDGGDAVETTEKDWREFINCIGSSNDRNSETDFKSSMVEKRNGDSDEGRGTGKEKKGSVGRYADLSKETSIPSTDSYDRSEVEKLEKNEISSRPISDVEVSSKRRVSWKDLEDQNTPSSSSDEYDDDDDDDSSSSSSSSCYSDDDERRARTVVVNFKHSSVQPVYPSIITPPTDGNGSEVSLITSPGDIYKLYKPQPKSILKARRSVEEVPKISNSKSESEIALTKKSVTVLPASQPLPEASQPEPVTKLVVRSNVIEKTQKDVTTSAGAKNTGQQMSKFKARQIAENQHSKNDSEIGRPKNSVTNLPASQPLPEASQPEPVTRLVVHSNVIEKTQKDVTTSAGAKNTGQRMSKFKARQIAVNQH